jgi:hypothetical protein
MDQETTVVQLVQALWVWSAVQGAEAMCEVLVQAYPEPFVVQAEAY